MKIKIVAIYLLLVTLFAPLFILYNTRTNQSILNNPDYQVTAQVIFNQTARSFPESLINKGEEGIYTYYLNVSGDTLPRDQDISVVISGLRGTWHRFYWNDMYIGSIGDDQHSSQHTWNQTYALFIDRQLIQSDNRFKVTTYSDYKIGFSKLPFIFLPTSDASKIIHRLNFTMSPFYNIIFWTMIILSISLIAMFYMSRYLDNRYALLPLAVILIAFYLLDYTTFSYWPLSALLIKKVLMMCLYTAVLLMSYIISRRYRKIYIIKIALLFFGVSSALVTVSSSMIQLNVHYRLANVLMIMQAMVWAFHSARQAYKHRHEEDLLFLLATLSLIIPTGIDVVSMIIPKAVPMRASVYGFILYAIAILITAFKHYIDAQKQLYASSQQLLLEHHHLQNELIKDELTGLGNHRNCIQALKTTIKRHIPSTLLIIDIDHFRAINNALGHDIGDQMLQRIAELLVTEVQDGNVFRYGGEEFVVLITETSSTSGDDIALKRAEKLRINILMDDALGALSQYHPFSVSIGISRYPLHSTEASTLIAKAEKACEFAKACGRNTVQAYNENVQIQLQGFAQVALKQELQSDFVLTLAATIDLKDTYTGKHSEFVARYSAILGEAMGLTHTQRYALRIGSLLHDLGKIAISDDILHKPTKLTSAEFDSIKKHTELGANLVAQVVDDQDIIACVKYHHEHFDGSGYPDGISGHSIPLFSRIVAIADAFHAMTSTRSYRIALSKEEAIQRLLDASNIQFDPQLVSLFVKAIRQEQTT